MKKLISLLVAIITTVSLLTACQPTPEVQPLQSKGQLQEKIEESEEVKVYEETLPHINSLKEFDNGHKYEIDADIIGQDAENIPIYSINTVVMEEGEPLGKRIRAAFEGYKLSEFFYPKEYYQKELLEYQGYLVSLKKGIDPTTGEPIPEGGMWEINLPVPLAKKYQVEVKPGHDEEGPTKIENLEALIEETVIKIQESPSQNEVIETDFRYTDGENGSHYMNIAATNDEELLSIGVSWNDYGDSYVDVYNHTLADASRKDDTLFKIFPDATTPIEELQDNEAFLKCKARAEEIIRCFGADYLELSDVHTIEGRDDFEMRFTRTVNGIRTIVPSFYYSNYLDTDLQDVIRGEAAEVFWVQFRQGRLYKVSWESPTEIEVVVDNAKVLPWEEILRIAEQHLEYIVLPSEGKHEFMGPYTDVVIDRIELGYTKMLVQDTYDEYQLIPTWNFFGHKRLAGFQDICFVTVNAVDGSIMDHRLGY